MAEKKLDRSKYTRKLKARLRKHRRRHRPSVARKSSNKHR